MTDDYDIEREEAQFEYDMEQIDRIAELERVNSELERVNAEYMDINHEQGMQLIESHKRIAELESLVRDACWLIVRASWTSVELDQLASDLCERMDELGLMEVER